MTATAEQKSFATCDETFTATAAMSRSSISDRAAAPNGHRTTSPARI